jgi:hypothetical protein
LGGARSGTFSNEGKMASETGVVKKWLSQKSFGFIKSDFGGADIFFHISALQDDAERMRETASPTTYSTMFAAGR